MSEVLSQDEVSALLQSMETGNVTTGSDARENDHGEVISYDFTSPDKVLKKEFGYLDMINEKYSVWFTETLSNSFRKPIEVKYEGVRTHRFGDLLTSFGFPTSLNLLDLEQLKGNAMLVFPPDLVYTLVELYFGGSGESTYKMYPREFTAIEQMIIDKMTDFFLRDYHEAWKTVYPLRMNVIKSEMDPRYLRFVGDDEPVVVVKFLLNVGEIQREFLFCFPYLVVEPVCESIEEESRKKETQKDPDAEVNLRQLVCESTVKLVVKIGNVKVSGKEILLLKQGDIVDFGDEGKIPTCVYVEGVKKFEAYLGRCKDSIAIKIIRILREGA